MKEILLKAKVPRKQISQVYEGLEVWGEPLKEKYYQTLLDIYVHEYREVVEILNLCPPEQWVFYEHMNSSGIRERILLTEAIKNLKNIFTKYLGEHEEENDRNQESAKMSLGKCV